MGLCGEFRSLQLREVLKDLVKYVMLERFNRLDTVRSLQHAVRSRFNRKSALVCKSLESPVISKRLSSGSGFSPVLVPEPFQRNLMIALLF